MADPALHPETQSHQTKTLKQIAVDYCPDACTHSPESDSIIVTFDHRGGARWRSTTRFHFGTFGAQIKCPKGNTSGLNFNLYLSSLEGDKSQDEIDFEFLGKDKTIVQTNYYTAGTGNREVVHDLGFDCSDGFHDYVIKWDPDVIEWLIDGIMGGGLDLTWGAMHRMFATTRTFVYPLELQWLMILAVDLIWKWMILCETAKMKLWKIDMTVKYKTFHFRCHKNYEEP
ncbi:hypothetical protein F0562_014830 [Nyssa sinensis]|uniref:GH16 domain-containing protein n=1 Tax=Nyssa sinensis TaxID=561372 RepID=A0A5J4ZRX3_9ASTE|nr:hypothetical protein F0562_014830 [Nyssa sinensis]